MFHEKRQVPQDLAQQRQRLNPLGESFTMEVKELALQDGGPIEQLPPGALASGNTNPSSAVRLEDLLRGMAFTHQFAIHATEGWGEINLAMHLMLLAAHQITITLTGCMGPKDNSVTGGITAMAATSVGTSQTG